MPIPQNPFAKVLYKKNCKLYSYKGKWNLVWQAKEMGLEPGFEIVNILALTKFVGKSIPYLKKKILRRLFLIWIQLYSCIWLVLIWFIAPWIPT